jgi:hypothetical protein
VAKFLLTFFKRDTNGARRYRFGSNSRYYLRVLPPEMIYEMMEWLDDHPLGKALAARGIGYAFSDMCPSSVVIDIPDDPDMLDDILVTVQLCIGREAELKSIEEIKPRLRNERMRPQHHDRYAR